jgi:RNA polymerase sigma-70 factor (ECF subfamily)
VNFEALANEHKDAVYRQMIRVCGNREDAEDVLVEALLRAYRHLGQLRDLVAFRSWLAQIARRICWQLKKREALLPLLQLSAVGEEGREIASQEPSIEEQLALRQMKDLLWEAVRKLPPVYRSVYEMRDLQEIPGEEVARQLGISLAAMKSRLQRGRELVREHLDASLTRPGQMD